MGCTKPKAESRAKITVATELVTQRNHPACGYVRKASCSSSANARDTIGTIDLAVERDSIVVAVHYTRLAKIETNITLASRSSRFPNVLS
jgi:hypothetical protein